MDDDVIEKIIEEELELTKKRIFTRIKMVKDGIQASGQRSMKLEFRNRISPIILTGEEIKGEGETTIEVVLIDDSTGNIVEAGPEASVRVGIVVLKGEVNSVEGDDWTAEEFNDNIVQEMEGMKPILAGNVTLKLQGGVGKLETIKFRHHATKIKPSVFRLGSRVVHTIGGVHIKEAKTESFTVKDFRNKISDYKKHKTPSLTDEVSRLVNIRKGGNIDKRLQDNQICTVEKFLIQLLINPEGLKKKIVKLGAKKWEVTVNNARACSGGNRMYCYVNFEKKMGIVFDILGRILRLYSKINNAPTNVLSETNKAYAGELLASAYEHWDDVKYFDEEDSLQQYLTAVLISTSMDPPNSNTNLHCPSDGLESSGYSDMIRDIGIGGMDIIGGDASELGSFSLSNLESMFSDFDESFHCVDRQLHGHVINDSNAVMFVESETFMDESHQQSSAGKIDFRLLVRTMRVAIAFQAGGVRNRELALGGSHAQKRQRV